MSDTPRTDEWCDEAYAFRRDVQVISADFARTLERELAAARRDAERLNALEALNGWHFHYYDEADGFNGPTWQTAQGDFPTLRAAIDAALGSPGESK